MESNSLESKQTFTPFEQWFAANRELAPKQPGPLFRRIIESLPDSERTQAIIRAKVREAYRSGEFESDLPDLGEVRVTDNMVRMR